jgi:hypothetical protein
LLIRSNSINGPSIQQRHPVCLVVERELDGPLRQSVLAAKRPSDDWHEARDNRIVNGRIHSEYRRGWPALVRGRRILGDRGLGRRLVGGQTSYFLKLPSGRGQVGAHAKSFLKTPLGIENNLFRLFDFDQNLQQIPGSVAFRKSRYEQSPQQAELQVAAPLAADNSTWKVGPGAM